MDSKSSSKPSSKSSSKSGQRLVAGVICIVAGLVIAWIWGHERVVMTTGPSFAIHQGLLGWRSLPVGMGNGPWKIDLLRLAGTVALTMPVVVLAVYALHQVGLSPPYLRAWLRRRDNRCGQCGYSREGLAASRCPECGASD